MNRNFVRIVVLLFILSQRELFAMNLTIIRNARFSPVNPNDYLRNLSTIPTRDQCLCQCYTFVNCSIVNYNGYQQVCTLFSAVLQMEQVHAVSINENAVVIAWSDRNTIRK